MSTSSDDDSVSSKSSVSEDEGSEVRELSEKPTLDRQKTNDSDAEGDEETGRKSVFPMEMDDGDESPQRHTDPVTKKKATAATAGAAAGGAGCCSKILVGTITMGKAAAIAAAVLAVVTILSVVLTLPETVSCFKEDEKVSERITCRRQHTTGLFVNSCLVLCHLSSCAVFFVLILSVYSTLSNTWTNPICSQSVHPWSVDTTNRKFFK